MNEIDLDGLVERDWEEETDADPVRFAMVGLGWWTREQAIPAVEASDYAETTVLVTGSPEKADDVAADVASVTATLTYEEYADGDAVDEYDAVYVCTPNALHHDHVRAAADLGKAVLCEKPLEASVEEAEALVDTCETADVPLMVAYRVTTGPAARRARDLIDGGAIGDVVSVVGHMSDTVLDSVGPDSWRLDPELSGGTTLNDIGIYPLNATRFVLGEDPRAVHATTTSAHEAFDGVDEHGAFTLEFSESLLGSYTVSHSADVRSSLRFVGTEGELTVEGIFFPGTQKVLRLSRGGTESEFRPPSPDQMREEFDYFANHLQRGAAVEPDGAMGVTDMRVVEALYESAESGERVEL
ncbi:D-xylose 1-dehydrogenase Gfo6 [Candidatus Halobonum tyrrellensis]|uniref:Glucose-fructose oxidoreductase n=1 Tax=Candidatus Halobonum tyrrellensis G22 TaxID=1324957 RepID=V4HHP6_9EURY|nr:D-xylose 1-dehydrogenase Gfo6 [Candidatus Halobonum tyrrellensis]ESP87424.1 glucose-fructose oxidoreductase [Candidatus Halobonum tyrrellensis G22]